MQHDRTRQIGALANSDVDGLINLASIARALDKDISELPPAYLRGRTAIRDILIERLDWSATRAERVVDQLEARGYIRFERYDVPIARRPARWTICPPVSGQ